MLPPGPNGPVGVAWLDLTKEHYGIHGTPEPQTIGRTESHGCIRHDQLGRDAAGADDEAGLHGDVRRHRAMLKVVGTAICHRGADQRLLDLVLSTSRSAPEPNGEVTAAGDIATVDPAAGRRWRSPKGVEVGPAGLAIPVVGREAGPAHRHLHPGPRRRRAAPRRDRHHGAEGTPVIAARRRHGRETVLQQRRRRDHRLCPLARPALDLLLCPSVGLCAGPRRGPAGQARPADRPRRPYRRCQRRRARTSISRSTGWRRASAGGRARRSIPIRCLPGRRPAARGAPIRGPTPRERLFPLSSSR